MIWNEVMTRVLLKELTVCNPYGGEQQHHCGSCSSLQKQ